MIRTAPNAPPSPSRWRHGDGALAAEVTLRQVELSANARIASELDVLALTFGDADTALDDYRCAA
jgi:hypothetical protein